MTDNTDNVAGNYQGGIRLTCILDEGAPTVSSTMMDQSGAYAIGATWASPLEEGDVVAISNDTGNTWATTGGIPLVEKPVNAETFVIGQIVSSPKLMVMPASSGVADSLAKRLAAKYYRVAEVEIWGGITKVAKAVVMHNGAQTVTPGDGANLHFNITSGYSASNQGLQFDVVNGNGVGVIPFHYVAAGADADLSNCLVGLTGLLIAATGA